MDPTIQRLTCTLPQIEQVLQITKAPSVTFGVVQNGKVIYRDSIGHRDNNPTSPKPDSNTKYMIGSCSKMFTSAAVGLLVDQGKMDWKDPVSKYIPEFNPVGDPRIGKEADIIDCLRHSTGIRAPSPLVFGPKSTLISNEEDVIPLLNVMPTEDDKGQRFNREWDYNNFLVGLVALAVQRVCGMRFADFVRERLLDPLGMDRTAMKRSEVHGDENVATPCAILSDGALHPADEGEWPCENHTPLLAATGMRSTLNDMLTWCIAVMDAEKAEEDPEYTLQIPNNPIKGMQRCRRGYWTRPSDDPDFSRDTMYCMGWWRARLPSSMLGSHSGNYFSRDKEYKTHLDHIIGKDHKEPFQMIGHTGGMRGAIFSVFTFPESGSAVVTMTNGRDYGDASDYTAQLLIQALFDLKPVVDLVPWAKKEAELAKGFHQKQLQGPWEENRKLDDPQRDTSIYLGEYRGFNGLFEFSIVPRDNETKLAVIFNHCEGSELPLLFYKKDTYSFFQPGEDLMKKIQIPGGEYKGMLLEFQVSHWGAGEGLRWKWEKDTDAAWFAKVK